MLLLTSSPLISSYYPPHLSRCEADDLAARLDFIERKRALARERGGGLAPAAETPTARTPLPRALREGGVVRVRVARAVEVSMVPQLRYAMHVSASLRLATPGRDNEEVRDDDDAARRGAWSFAQSPSWSLSLVSHRVRRGCRCVSHHGFGSVRLSPRSDQERHRATRRAPRAPPPMTTTTRARSSSTSSSRAAVARSTSWPRAR